MKIFDQFDLFLFDFDGVLVDTECLHYAAYEQMLINRGIAWDWDFEQYCHMAHGEAQGIKMALYRAFPELLRQEPNWEVLAKEKKQHYEALIQNRPLKLMPGVEKMLQQLQQLGRKSCVVTNSLKEHVESIKDNLPILRTIAHWITRADYTHPKPSPEGYLKAIALYGLPEDRVIGFEDTFKGFKALAATKAYPILICPAHRSHVPECLTLGGRHVESFEDLLNNTNRKK